MFSRHRYGSLEWCSVRASLHRCVTEQGKAEGLSTLFGLRGAGIGSFPANVIRDTADESCGLHGLS